MTTITSEPEIIHNFVLIVFFFFLSSSSSPPINLRRGSACERLWVAAKSCAPDKCDRVSQHSTRSFLYFWSGRGQRARRNYEDGTAAVTLYKWRARTSSVIFRVRYALMGVEGQQRGRIRWAVSSQGWFTCRARAEPGASSRLPKIKHPPLFQSRDHRRPLRVYVDSARSLRRQVGWCGSKWWRLPIEMMRHCSRALRRRE